MTTPTPPPNRPSRLLLAFLILPLAGLAAAGVFRLVQGNPTQPTATPAPPTPLAVSLPPLPTLAPVIDAPVLDFSLPALADGEMVRLSDYAGRPVFLNFWATWCEPCKRELPAFEQFTAAQGDSGAVVLAVNSGEDEAAVRAFLEAQDISGLRVLLDPEASAAIQYGVFQIPVTFVIDASGFVRYPHYGEMTLDDLASYMTALEDAGAAGG